jgi:hypothetical protein
MWMAIAGAALAYAVWNFFLTFPRSDDSAPKS